MITAPTTTHSPPFLLLLLSSFHLLPVHAIRDNAAAAAVAAVAVGIANVNNHDFTYQLGASNNESVVEGGVPCWPDSAMPKPPIEFLGNVHKTCRALLYGGGRFLYALPDAAIIEMFDGCAPASRGFCKGTCRISPRLNGKCYYKRSRMGLWIFAGLERQEKPKCTEPPASNMMEELLDLTNPFNFDKNQSSSAEQKLPRIADLPLTAPMPEWFAKEYATECRSVKAFWNVLYRHVPAEQFYKQCKFSRESFPYCVAEPIQEPNARYQYMVLRSTSGGYEVGGFKMRDPVFERCRLN